MAPFIKMQATSWTITRLCMALPAAPAYAAKAAASTPLGSCLGTAFTNDPLSDVKAGPPDAGAKIAVFLS